MCIEFEVIFNFWGFQHGADPTKKNRDGATPLDLVKESDQDVADLLRGNAALLDAAKKGNLARIQRLLTTENMNCRDLQGRNSTPLHLAGTYVRAWKNCCRCSCDLLSSHSFTAGYNNIEVAEYLLERGADVNAQDKGGLIPLHNASSYGHLDIAALLIKYNTAVNATDKWGFTPLHEAAQKGRTQLSALLVSGILRDSRFNRMWTYLLNVCFIARSRRRSLPQESRRTNSAGFSQRRRRPLAAPGRDGVPSVRAGCTNVADRCAAV